MYELIWRDYSNLINQNIIFRYFKYTKTYLLIFYIILKYDKNVDNQNENNSSKFSKIWIEINIQKRYII